MERFAIRGNICYSENQKSIRIIEHGYVICEEGKSIGIFRELPEQWKKISCRDYGDRLIIPGLVDLHVHAPQYSFRGLGMDLELIDWLNTHTFPEEEKYQDTGYAKKAYTIFTEDLLHSATTRACVFGTCHKDATLWLMEQMEKAGLAGYVGKVNMDRNSSRGLCEKSAEASAKDTEAWILESEKFSNIRPILTPRFIPTCSDELMERLSKLQKRYGLPAQSHLSENLSEIEWVRELQPKASCYGDAYRIHGLFGGDCPTIMAHCVYSSEEEIRMIKEQGVFVAHCPESNANLSSGLTDQSIKPLTVAEAFYLATKGGGEFFGEVGSLEAGYEFDAVVLDDSKIRRVGEVSVRDRLERLIYLDQDAEIEAKYVKGKMIAGKGKQ